MRLTASLSRMVVAIAALGLVTAISTARAANSGLVEVRGLSDGKATYSTDGKTFKSLRIGVKLPEKSIVRTEEGTKLNMRVVQGSDTSIVRAQQHTQLGFDKLQYEETGAGTVVENKFDLPSGDIMGNVEKIAAASKYEINTPNGVAGIRGTQYAVSSSGAVTVVSGRVSVTIARQVTNVATGQTTQVTVQVTVEAGQTFTPPPLTAAGNATLVQMAAASAQVQAAQVQVAAAAASGNAQQQQQAQAALATAQQGVAQAQATALTQAAPTLLVSVTAIIGQTTTQIQQSVNLTPRGPEVGTQVQVVVPEPVPVITVTGTEGQGG